MENSYPRFTKDMIKTHTILIPTMLKIHFKFFFKLFKSEGFNVEQLENEGPEVIEEGLKYVHNDTCYPALLVIGQFIDALNHRDDTHNVVLIITQTGGGCRASNYLHLLRKALIKAGYDYIPVVSLNMSNLEKDSAVQITVPLIKKAVVGFSFGDLLMYLYNKTRSYEKEPGSAWKLTEEWIEKLTALIEKKKCNSYRKINKYCNEIAASFDKLPLVEKDTVKVGVVGEIYIKYSALGNNNLEQFLVDNGAEVLVPGLYGFMFYSLYNSLYDYKIYHEKFMKTIAVKFLIKYMARRENLMIKAIKKYSRFEPMNPFSVTKELSNGVISHGVKMGEGWLLTAEMMELVEIGFDNIVCAQPFGCLPNHIAGKAVMKKIRHLHPNSNIVAIDYDPSSTKVNQENRIKLMLSIARENKEKAEKEN